MSQNTIAAPDLSIWSEMPTIKGRKGPVKWIKENIGVEITENAVVEAVYYKKTLPRYRIGQTIYFSERDLVRWILSMKKCG